MLLLSFPIPIDVRVDRDHITKSLMTSYSNKTK